jgi:hypothetical protein
MRTSDIADASDTVGQDFDRSDIDDDDLGGESQNSAAIELGSILDGLWVPCLLEHAYTSSSSSLEILTSFG